MGPNISTKMKTMTNEAIISMKNCPYTTNHSYIFVTWLKTFHARFEHKIKCPNCYHFGTFSICLTDSAYCYFPQLLDDILHRMQNSGYLLWDCQVLFDSTRGRAFPEKNQLVISWFFT